MAKSVGKIFAELDLDDSAYLKSQQDVLRTASATAVVIEQTLKSAGVKTDAIYNQMRLNAEKSFQAVAQSSSASSKDIIEAEKARTDAMKKINDDQRKNAEDTFDKIKDKLLEVAETATYVAGILATTLIAFSKGAELGGVSGGIFAGSLALGVELYTALGSANAQAADLDDKYQKIYDAKKNMAILGITEKETNAEINALVGDQLSAWSKIKESLPDILQELIRQDEKDLALLSNLFSGGGTALSAAGKVAIPDIMTAFNISDIDSQMEQVVSSLKKPEAEVKKFFESATETQQKELALQLVNYRDNVNAIATSQQEKHNLMSVALVEYYVNSKQILAQGAATELSIFQKLSDDMLASMGKAHDPKVYDSIVEMMKQKFSIMQDAEEISDTIILKNKDAAHALRLSREEAFGENLAKAARENASKVEEAYRLKSDSWLLKDVGRKDNAQDIMDAARREFESKDKASRIKAVQQERDDRLYAAKQLGDDTARIYQMANDKIEAINKEGAEKAAKSYGQTITDGMLAPLESSITAFDKTRDEWNKLTLSAYDYQKLNIANWFEKETLALGGENEMLIAVRTERERIAALTESKRIADQNLVYMPAGYNSDMFIGMPDANKRADAMWKEAVKNNSNLVELSKRTADAMERNFSNFFFDSMTGKFQSMSDMWSSMLNTLARMTSDIMGQIAREMLFGVKNGGEGLASEFGTLLSSWFTSSAKGNVFSGSGISAYENQIVTRPTVFPFARGIGLMGEAGAEAIMPLTRTSSGKLGVQSEGGGLQNITFNVVNNSSTEIKQQQPKISWNLQGMVIDMIIDGVQRDVNGARSFFGGR